MCMTSHCEVSHLCTSKCVPERPLRGPVRAWDSQWTQSVPFSVWLAFGCPGDNRFPMWSTGLLRTVFHVPFRCGVKSSVV
jgi:hypothetical protein